jgi:methylmalonyl-CoA/ethylmalonyl-CoA epimerase
MIRVFQVAQHVDDLDRARDFYAQLLDAAPTGVFDPPGLVFFQAGSVRLLLERAAPSALIYLLVADVRGAVRQCQARGTEIISEPHVIFRHSDDALGPAGTSEWMAFVRDSEGNTVGLVSHHPPGS